MTDFPTLFYILQPVKSLPFHIPEAWKRYPLWAKPPLMAIIGSTPPPPSTYHRFRKLTIIILLIISQLELIFIIVFSSDSKFWTRNRLGDRMRDKYNLNILDTEDDAGKSTLHRGSGISLISLSWSFHWWVCHLECMYVGVRSLKFMFSGLQLCNFKIYQFCRKISFTVKEERVLIL